MEFLSAVSGKVADLQIQDDLFWNGVTAGRAA